MSIQKPWLCQLQKQPMQKDVLRNFTKFTGTHLCQSLFFNKVVDLRLATLLKKRLWHRCFCEISEKIFFTEHVWTTASTAGQLDVKLRSRCEVLLPSELRNYIAHWKKTKKQAWTTPPFWVKELYSTLGKN